MSTTPVCRILIDDRPNCGTWNMAVDETLLHSALQEEICTLRWYRWSRPTISLGYFQDMDSLGENPQFEDLDCVRRISGGGAILHHHELTYSCALPASHSLARSPHQLYKQIHTHFIDVLRENGIDARLRGEQDPRAEGAFLCFGRGDPRDIVIGNHKILGSAQRRYRGAVIQHGSLLLKRSQHAPQFPGILDFGDVAISERDLLTDLNRQIASILGRSRPLPGLRSQEISRAKFLQQQRYRKVHWKHRNADLGGFSQGESGRRQSVPIGTTPSEKST